MMARRLFLFAFTVGLLTAFGCSNETDPILFRCTDAGTPGENTVNLSCGGLSDETLELVDVVFGGPASGTTTLAGLNFDLTYDPSKVEFVNAGSYTSPMFPGALIAVSLLDGEQGQIVVSIQNTGDALVSVGPGQHEVLALTFQRVSGTKFDPTPVTIVNAEPTDASAPILFENGLSLSYQ